MNYYKYLGSGPEDIGTMTMWPRTCFSDLPPPRCPGHWCHFPILMSLPDVTARKPLGPGPSSSALCCGEYSRWASPRRSHKICDVLSSQKKNPKLKQ